MRILVIGSVYPDSFADNVLVSLQDAGHEALAVAPYPDVFNRGARLTARLRSDAQAVPRLARRLQRQVLDAAAEHRPELVLNLDHQLSFTLVPELRALTGAPIAFWFPDSAANLGRETHVLAGYDAVFLKDTAVAERYRRVLGINAHFLAEACNPRWHRPIGDVSGPAERPAVLIAGNMYATRLVLVRALLERGVEVVVEGPPWARWLPADGVVRRTHTGRYLAREQKARAFRAAPVVLNALGAAEGDGLNCRLFEATACGALVVSEWRPRLPELFDEQREVRSYRDFETLVLAIEKLCALDHEQRRAMGDAAAARARRQHTYTHRFARMLSALGCG